MKKTVISFFLIALFISQAALAQLTSNNNAIEQKAIFNAINAYRVQHGLSALKLNSEISAAAEQHSQDMADKHVPFGHEGFRSRIRTLFREFNHPRGAAENVAYIYGGDTMDVVDMWLHSSGHRRNIEGSFNLTGIGIAHDSQGRVYVTQIFLRA